MSHSPESIEALIRESTSLKTKIGMIARSLDCDAADCKKKVPLPVEKEQPGPGILMNQISFIKPLPDGLEKTITDIFSLVCGLSGVTHAGIYVFNRSRRQLDMVCHYNLPNDFLARVITLHHDSWQVNAVFEGFVDFKDFQRIPLHAKITFEQLGIHAIAVIPLIYNGQIVGCMHLGSQKEEFVNGFEKVVIEGLAARISRTVALHLAQVRLSAANEELKNLILKIKMRFELLIRPLEPKPLTGFFVSMKGEIEGLSKAIFLATERIMEKLKDGQQTRELPFIQKKVDALLSDIDLLVQIIGRLRVFCNSQSAVIEQGMMQITNTGDAAFLNSMDEVYHALELLVLDWKKQEIAHNAYVTGHFKPLQRPIKLTDLNIRIDRLIPN